MEEQHTGGPDCAGIGTVSGVTIRAELFSADDIEEKINTTIASGGELPDLLPMDDWIANLLQYPDMFVDLYEAPCNAKEIEDQYVEWKWKRGETVDGRLIALPMDIGPTCMFYNASLFEAAGLPTEPADVAAAMSTWEDAYAAAGKLQEAAPDVRCLISWGICSWPRWGSSPAHD